MNANRVPKCLLISDMKLDGLAEAMSYTAGSIVEPILLPPGDLETLINNNDYWQYQPDFAFVWARPDEAIPSFSAACHGEQTTIEMIREDVASFTAHILKAADKVGKALIVCSWTLPYFRPGIGINEFSINEGIAYRLRLMDLILADSFSNCHNIILRDASRWLAACGQTSVTAESVYTSNYYSQAVFNEASRDITGTINGLMGKSKKVILVDLDNTVWGGTVGETGVEGLIIGGDSTVGRAFADFQYVLKELTKRGIIIGIISRNTESIALKAIDEHPNMILRRDDFVGWRINWGDKAENIISLMNELNLGLDSAVFIDDHPAERDRVRKALPELLVPELPEDPRLYVNCIRQLMCFDNPFLTQEDRIRTKLYVDERNRQEIRNQAQSADDWLESIGTRVVISQVTEDDLPRVVQ